MTHVNQKDDQHAEHLAKWLEARSSNQEQSLVEGIDADEAHFLNGLFSISKTLNPSPEFVNDLKMQLCSEESTSISWRLASSKIDSSSFRIRKWQLRKALIAATFIVILATGVTSVPLLRSLAQDIWHYFDHSENDAMTIEQIEFSYEHFTQTSYFLEPAQAATDFEILELPAQHFRLDTVSYASSRGEVVQLDYIPRYDPATSEHQYQGIFGIGLTEIWVGDGPVQLSTSDTIGPEATVEVVSIGGVQGEFVVGNWATDDPESGVFTWTLDYFYQLRWEENGIFFKMVAFTLPRLAPDISSDQIRDTMISLAESLE
jgi:hypothetical protein